MEDKVVVGREILCGLDYLQIISVAGDGVSMREAAKKLGVGEDHFRRRMKELGMGHYFQRSYARSKCITPEDVTALAAEGYNQKDAAFMAGVEYGYFKETVREYGLSHLFPTRGKASWISRRGYVGKDT